MNEHVAEPFRSILNAFVGHPPGALRPSPREEHEMEREAAWQREHECHVKGCEASPDRTNKCWSCDQAFCLAHLDGNRECAGCAKVAA